MLERIISGLTLHELDGLQFLKSEHLRFVANSLVIGMVLFMLFISIVLQGLDSLPPPFFRVSSLYAVVRGNVEILPLVTAACLGKRHEWSDNCHGR